MTPTRDALKSLPRPVRLVELPGGGSVHVRALTLAEMRRVDARAAELPDGTERNVRTMELLAAAGLAEADGRAVFPAVLGDDQAGAAEAIAAVAEALTPHQIEAVCAAAAGPSKDDAKNG